MQESAQVPLLGGWLRNACEGEHLAAGAGRRSLSQSEPPGPRREAAVGQLGPLVGLAGHFALEDVPPDFRDASPVRRNAPLLRRRTLRWQRPAPRYTPLGPAAVGEFLDFPHCPFCASCERALRPTEARWGTGLCDECYGLCTKDCIVCNAKLPLKQLQWGSELCKNCFNACEKNCKVCSASLANEQLHWNTGLCDSCYEACERTCRMCKCELQPGQRRWGTGLCSSCYSSCQKSCCICKDMLQDRQLRWGTGLCDQCYDACEKACKICKCKIALGSVHWRTGLCDTCYDAGRGFCKICKERLDPKRASSGTGLCDICFCKSQGTLGTQTCEMCHGDLGIKQQHWGTGLCDCCYNSCEKNCLMCSKLLLFGESHWASSLCNDCYTSCDKTCRICGANLPLGTLHWGTRLCDPCFDNCEKLCRNCRSPIDFEQLHWGTGFCNKCYDKARSKAVTNPGLSTGVRAIIGAQLVFYMVPASLQPSLYLEIRSAGYAPSAPSVFAAVLTTASALAMVAPVPLGFWAERRGEREVYYGIMLAAGVAAVVFLLLPPAPVFAIAWAVLNAPPAVRGVRAAYFAKHVPPEELSRAGQLASSAGLTGGFLGPLASALASHLADRETRRAGRWLDSFHTCAMLSAVACTVSAAFLAATIPLSHKQRRAGSRADLPASSSSYCERCERCEGMLTETERNYATALCDKCYDSFYGTNYSFGRFCRNVLLSFCMIAALLEASMNAGIIAAFQPIAVGKFNWGEGAIAAVNFAGAGLSIIISLMMAQLRLPERSQTAAAAGLYLIGVLVFTMPPLSEWRMVLGLMLGIKAQILFMAPFTAIFSRLIGRARVTNWRTTVLCLAPAIGAALGTTMAPICIVAAGTPASMLAAVPAFFAVLAIAYLWRMMKCDVRPQPQRRFT